MINSKLNFAVFAAVLGLAISQAQAIQISFSGSSSTSGALGNTRVFSEGGVTVTASAQSLIGGVGAWQDSYLGLYSGGLGVTNSAEGSGSFGTHTTDNLGSDDRVIFSFSSAVILDSVGLSAYGDTDITAYYFSGGVWNFLENNLGGTSNRTADINATAISASLWAVGAMYPASFENDSFKIKKINFNQAPVSGAPVVPVSVPDAGGSLLLLAIGLGILSTFQRQTANS